MGVEFYSAIPTVADIFLHVGTTSVMAIGYNHSVFDIYSFNQDTMP